MMKIKLKNIYRNIRKIRKSSKKMLKEKLIDKNY